MVELVEYVFNPIAWIIAAKQLTQIICFLVCSEFTQAIFDTWHI